jgi:hypothetical protein
MKNDKRAFLTCAWKAKGGKVLIHASLANTTRVLLTTRRMQRTQYDRGGFEWCEGCVHNRPTSTIYEKYILHHAPEGHSSIHILLSGIRVRIVCDE